MRTLQPPPDDCPRPRSRRRLAVLTTAAAVLAVVGLPWVWSPAEAQDPATCPIGQDQFGVIGGHSAASAMRAWAVTVCQSSSLDLGLDYTFTNDSEARARMLEHEAVFAVGQMPFQAYDEEHLAAKGAKAGDFVYVPLLVTGLVCVQRMITQFDDAPKSIWLDPSRLALLHNGRLLNAMDIEPDLVAANQPNPDALPLWPEGPRGAEGQYFPMDLQYVMVPSGFNGSTKHLLQYIYGEAKGAAAWESLDTSWLPPGGFKPGVHDSMPVGTPYNSPTSGEDRVMFEMQGETLALRRGKMMLGCINSSVSSAAMAQAFPTDPRFPPDAKWSNYLRVTSLKNLKGNYVAPSADTLNRAAALMKDSGDGTFATPTTEATWTDASAYPIPALTFAIVPKKFADEREWKQTTDFLKWATDQGQKQLPEGYVPLTPAMAARAKSQIAAIAGPTPEATTTTEAPSDDDEPIGGSDDGFGALDDFTSDPFDVDDSSFSDSIYDDGGSYSGDDGSFSEEIASGDPAAEGAEPTSNLGQQPTGLRSILAVLGGGNALPPTLFAFVAVLLLATAPILRRIDRRQSGRLPGAGR